MLLSNSLYAIESKALICQETVRLLNCLAALLGTILTGDIFNLYLYVNRSHFENRG